jgi:hypothetical protein
MDVLFDGERGQKILDLFSSWKTLLKMGRNLLQYAVATTHMRAGAP